MKGGCRKRKWYGSSSVRHHKRRAPKKRPTLPDGRPVWKAYNKASYRKARKAAQPAWCEECLKRGVFTPNPEWHHKIKVRDRPDLITDSEDNAMWLCRSCHRRLESNLEA